MVKDSPPRGGAETRETWPSKSPSIKGELMHSPPLQRERGKERGRCEMIREREKERERKVKKVES